MIDIKNFRNINYAIEKLLIIGFIMLAFSTSRSSGLVFSPGFVLIYGSSVLIFFMKKRGVIEPATLVFVISVWIFSCMPMIFSLYSSDPLPSLWRAITYLFGFLLFFGLAFNTRFKNRDLPSHLIILSTSTISLYYILNFVLQSRRYGFNNVILDRASGGLAELPWGASNVVAAVIFIGLIVALSKKGMDEFKYKSVIIFLMTLGIFITFSRTVIISTLIIFLFYLLKRKSFKTFIVLIISIFTIFISYQNLSLQNKYYVDMLIADRTSVGRVDSFNGRTDIWKSALDQSSYNLEPQGYYSAFITMGHSAHSLYLSTLLEQGLIGLIVIIVLIISMLTLLYLSKDFMLTIGILIMFIGLSFEDLFYCQQYILLFFVLSANTIRRYNERNAV